MTPWPTKLLVGSVLLLHRCRNRHAPPDFKTSAIQIHPGLLSLCGPQIWVLFYTLLFSSMKHEKCVSVTVLIEICTAKNHYLIALQSKLLLAIAIALFLHLLTSPANACTAIVVIGVFGNRLCTHSIISFNCFISLFCMVNSMLWFYK